MLKQEDILTKVRAANKEAPSGAFAVELGSNEEIVGNLNSKHMYNQTPDTDNGLNKMASNKYLEKIARVKYKGIAGWTKRLVKNVADAEPLTQVGLATGAVIGTGKVGGMISDARKKQEKLKLEEKSLKALHGINKALNTGTLVKAAAPLPPINRIAQKAMNNMGKALSTNKIAPGKLPIQRPKGM